MSPNQSDTPKKSSAIKLLHKFMDALDVKHKTGVFKLGSAREKRKEI